MPINTKYEGYDLAIKKVTRVRDFADGEFTVKAKGAEYLPKLGGQTSDDYDAYLTRGFIIPAVEPTSSAITGAVMRKPPVFEPVGTLEHLIGDIDGMGTGIVEFTGDMIKELLYAGSAGYLVEFTDKPIIKRYAKESIINIADDFIVLTQEYIERDKKDKFKQVTKIEYLELTFDENGNYIQNIWREVTGKKGYGIVDTIMPTNRKVPLKEFPFVLSDDLMTDPTLLHLANVNLDQYRMSTDHRHGLHWTALPTLFLFGDLTDNNGNKVQIKVGAGTANHINNDDARVELLEFTGQGIGALKEAIDSNIETMASIGAKMLVGGSAGVKSAETSRIEASSETAILSMLANTVDNTMHELLVIMSEWAGAPLPEFTVNRDFIDVKLDPAALLAYLQVLQSGGMSLNSFLNLLFKGELLPSGVTPEEEAASIETTGFDFEAENEETTQL